MSHSNTEVIGILPRTRLYRIERCDSVLELSMFDSYGGEISEYSVRRACWRVWTATADYVHGTFIELHDDGSAYQVTVRKGEGDECFRIK